MLGKVNKIIETISNFLVKKDFLLQSKGICPYCKFKFKKIPGRKKECPECKNYIYIRTHPDTQEKLICTEKGMQLIDDMWNKEMESSSSSISITQGIGTVIENFGDKIYCAEYIDINDGKSCEFCKSMNLSTFRIDDPVFIELKDVYGFGGGEKDCKYCSCQGQYRGRWVYILSDQVEKPKITGLSLKSIKIMKY